VAAVSAEDGESEIDGTCLVRSFRRSELTELASSGVAVGRK
jgi:hypothetical protein